MTQHSHQTAPTRFVEANGIRFASRGIGRASALAPAAAGAQVLVPAAPFSGEDRGKSA